MLYACHKQNKNEMHREQPGHLFNCFLLFTLFAARNYLGKVNMKEEGEMIIMARAVRWRSQHFA